MAEERNTPTRQATNRRNQSEKIALVRNRVSHARQARQEWQIRFKLNELYEKYLGDPSLFGSGFDDDELMQVNRFWPDIKTLIPSLFLQSPIFIVRSKNEASSPDSILRAKMAEAGLRAIAEQEHHLEFSVKLALLQSFFSIGVLKSVFEPKLRKNPQAGEPMFENINGTPILDPDTNQLIELLGPDGQPVFEPDRIVDDETYRWDWVNGDKMLLPDSGPNHLRWGWIAEEVTIDLDKARNDERFPSNLRNQLRANTSGDETLGSGMGSGFGEFPRDGDTEGDEFITYVEYWDIKKRRQIVWVDGQTFSDTRFLLDRDYPDGVEEHPYSLLKYSPIIAPKPSPWPVPHVWNWLPIQNEYNSRRKQGMIGAKRSARKVYYDDGTFPDADFAVAALQSSEDMQGVKLNDVQRAPVVVADPPPPPNITQDLAIIENDWNRTTGIGPTRAGGRAGSATEARIAQGSGEARDLDMRHEVNIWLTTAGRKMLQLLQGTLTLGMFIRLKGTNDSLYLNYVARVYGPEFAQNVAQFPGVRQAFDEQFGDERWLVLNREDLEFQADVSIAPGSARPRNMENEKQDFIQIIQILGSVPILTQSRALLTRVADMFEFFDGSMIDEILAASQRTQQIEAIQAGRFQGGGNEQPTAERPAAEGGGANVSEFRRNFTG